MNILNPYICGCYGDLLIGFILGIVAARALVGLSKYLQWPWK